MADTTTILLMVTVPNTFRGCSEEDVRRKLQPNTPAVMQQLATVIVEQIDNPITPETVIMAMKATAPGAKPDA